MENCFIGNVILYIVHFKAYRGGSFVRQEAIVCKEREKARVQEHYQIAGGRIYNKYGRRVQ